MRFEHPNPPRPGKARYTSKFFLNPVNTYNTEVAVVRAGDVICSVACGSLGPRKGWGLRKGLAELGL